MLEEVKKYRIRCDADGCGRKTSAIASPHLRTSGAEAEGWKFCEIPAAQMRLWVCPQCFATGRRPVGWEDE